MLDKAKQDAKKRAHVRLEALKKTVAERLSDRPLVALVYVEELNSILRNLKQGTGVNLDEFGVPENYFKKEGEGGEEGIEPPLLLAKINAALEYVGTL